MNDESIVLFVFSTIGMLALPIVYFFSKKRRKTLDELSFLLRNFRRFFYPSILLCTFQLFPLQVDKTVLMISVTGIVILVSLLCQRSITHRHKKNITFLRVISFSFIGAQIILFFYTFREFSIGQYSLQISTVVYLIIGQIYLLKSNYVLLQERESKTADVTTLLQ